MGRRSRKRGIAAPPSPPPPVAAQARPAPRTPRRRARVDEAPPAPWSPFPLQELATFAGLVLMAVGFFAKRPVVLATGVVLVALAALELAFREHFSGYRSHSALLAGVVAVGVGVPLFFARLPRIALLPAVAVLGGMVFVLFRRAFRRRAGGMGFRA